jgi:hypothetical protein
MPDVLKFTDVPAVIAASKCYLARQEGMPLRIRVDHNDCGWCSYPCHVIIESVRAWWDGDHTESAAAFERLPHATQQRLVSEAAGVAP